MKTLLAALLIGALSLTAFAHDEQAKSNDAKPIPVPTNIRVSSSKPRATVWDSLTEKEKTLAYHLVEAARAGRTILFHQNHRHGLKIKALIEEAFRRENIADTKALLGEQGFKEFLNYSAKFQDMGGPYEPSNRKYVLEKVTAEQVLNLIAVYGSKIKGSARAEIARLLTDPSYETVRMPESHDGTGIEHTGGNLYEKGISTEELQKAFAEGLQSCLNCRIVRGPDGRLTTEVQTVNTPGPVGKALRKVVKHLRLALPHASTQHQSNQIGYLIRYLEKGNIEDFRKFNIEWVLDGTSSKVDFMMGFVEVYEDFKANIGSWESYVQVIDPKTTEVSVNLARNAQYFENMMPYGSFKKTFPPGYAPPALMVYYFQEIASMHTAGYNLPNFDDIRRDKGFKNAIRLDMPGQENDPAAAARWREIMSDFSPAERFPQIEKHHEKAWRVLVLLHEIIGHGSGTYDEAKYGKGVDPISKLGSLGSALEEQRADLAALVFAGDKKLVEVGIYESEAEAREVRNALYDYYAADFLKRTARDRSFNEAHQRGHWLFVGVLLERGAVEFRSRDGIAPMTPENTVLVVTDYELFHQVSKDLLSELQRIKATYDKEALVKLFDEKAPLGEINKPWAQAVIDRGQKLQINAGAVEQPWRLTRELAYKVLCEDLLLEKVAPQWINQ